MLFLLGATALAPRVARAEAQVGAVHRIGMLSSFSTADTAPWNQAFRNGLRELGWTEGKNIHIEYRHADGKDDRLPALAAELVGLRVDVIVAAVTPDALAAKRATRTIPIVMGGASDPIAVGLVENLARPGGNITGLSRMTAELAGKRLELLKEMVPGLSRVAVLWNPQSATSTLAWKELQQPARQLGIRLHSLEVRSGNDLDSAFVDAARACVGALFTGWDPVFFSNLRRIAGLAARNRLPSIFHVTEYTDAGGLVAYGPDRADIFRRAAAFVDKVLKGANPGDLPVEQPTKLELVINRKTAKEIGLTIPQNVLFRADRVIE